MSTISRERAQEIFLGNGPEPTASEERELARIALASLEAECHHQWSFGGKNKLQRQKQCVKCGRVELAAPPAPVSVPAGYRLQPISEYDAMCAAMLQGTEPVTAGYKLPMQPLAIDAHGTLRFKENPIVSKLLDYATDHGYGLNEMALEQFDAEDRMQLAQLIGYSLSGYGSLSYVTDESYERAAATAPQQE